MANPIFLTALTYALSDLVPPRALNVVLSYHLERVCRIVASADEDQQEQARRTAERLLERVQANIQHESRAEMEPLIQSFLAEDEGGALSNLVLGPWHSPKGDKYHFILDCAYGEVEDKVPGTGRKLPCENCVYIVNRQLGRP